MASVVEPISLGLADLISYDAEGLPVLLIEVKLRRSDPSVFNEQIRDSILSTTMVNERIQNSILSPIKRACAEAVGDAYEHVRQRLASPRLHVPYLMIVDPEQIQVLGSSAVGTSPITTLSTPEILSHYDEDFSRKRIFPNYMTILIEGWMRDLAYRWKSSSPPGQEAMASLGLLARLEGGTTRMIGESLNGDFVS